jgi:replicative DNA helicase
MTKQSCGDRILSNLTGIDGLKVLSGDLTGEKNAHARIAAGYNKIIDANLTFSDAIGFSWQEIDYLVDNMKGIDILIIDYIQMVAGQGQMRKEAIDDYIKKLRAVAVRKNICVVIASQINRGGADGTMPQMKDLKSTGCLEEIADKVILLHYNYFYTKAEDEYNQYEVLLEKNRQGMTMAKKCVIYPELCKIGECYEPSGFKRSN